MSRLEPEELIPILQANGFKRVELQRGQLIADGAWLTGTLRSPRLSCVSVSCLRMLRPWMINLLKEDGATKLRIASGGLLANMALHRIAMNDRSQVVEQGVSCFDMMLTQQMYQTSKDYECKLNLHSNVSIECIHGESPALLMHILEQYKDICQKLHMRHVPNSELLCYHDTVQHLNTHGMEVTWIVDGLFAGDALCEVLSAKLTRSEFIDQVIELGYEGDL